MPDVPLLVDPLMAEVEREVAADAAEPRFPLLQLTDLLPELVESQRVIARPPLIGRSAYERVWSVINRTLRRGACHAVEPAVGQQNEWNDAVVATLHGLLQSQDVVQAEVLRRLAEQRGRQ